MTLWRLFYEIDGITIKQLRILAIFLVFRGVYLLGLITNHMDPGQYGWSRLAFVSITFLPSVHKHCKYKPCHLYRVSLHKLSRLGCFLSRDDTNVFSGIHGEFFLPMGHHDVCHQLLRDELN